MTLQTCRSVFYLDQDMSDGASEPIASGQAVVFSARCPDREGANEDAAALIRVEPNRGVLIVADGFGGHPSGAQAAEISVRQIERSVCESDPAGESLRTAIVDGFEKANEEVRGLGVGAATTLAVVDIEGDQVRSYHVGDSAILVVGQRGKIKARTVAHSPVGYAVESGLIDEREAMNHEERHVVSNMVGSAEMRIEIGPSLKLARRDTVLIGSDGLFDNILFEHIVERIRVGPLKDGVRKLAALTRKRMLTPDNNQPSKPDDLTLIAFRRNT